MKDKNKQKMLRELIEEYLLNRMLYQDSSKNMLMADKRIENKEYLVEKRIRDYLCKRGYEKRKTVMIERFIRQDLTVKKNAENDMMILETLLQEEYQKINDLVLTLTDQEFMEVCQMMEGNIKSFDRVLTDNPYSDGRRLIPLIGLTENEKYLMDKKAGYQELLFQIKAIFNGKGKKYIRKRNGR